LYDPASGGRRVHARKDPGGAENGDQEEEGQEGRKGEQGPEVRPQGEVEVDARGREVGAKEPSEGGFSNPNPSPSRNESPEVRENGAKEAGGGSGAQGVLEACRKACSREGCEAGAERRAEPPVAPSVLSLMGAGWVHVRADGMSLALRIRPEGLSILYLPEAAE